MNWERINRAVISFFSHQITKLAGSIFLFTLALFLIMDWLVMPLYTRHGQEVTMPDITDMRFEDAKRKLEENGFHIVNDEERYSSDHPTGFVMEQNPAPKSKVKNGRRVYVTVSRGIQRVFMPKLVGRSQRDAELLLSRNRLVIDQVNYEHSNIHPEGVIVRQSIPPDAEISINSGIDVTVSLGQEPSVFIVPQLEGRPLEDARRRLKQAGLRVGQLTKVVIPDLLPDTVIRQAIEPNTIVDKNTPIDLEISTDNDH